MDYEALRAEYDAAFGGLRAAVWELQSITQGLSLDKLAGEAERQRVDQALGRYRECRNNLVGFLISHQSAGRPTAYVDSQPPSICTPGMDRRAAGSDDGAFDRGGEVQVLAFHLWEKAGRPIGSPDENWYRAEEMLRSGQ